MAIPCPHHPQDSSSISAVHSLPPLAAEAGRCPLRRERPPLRAKIGGSDAPRRRRWEEEA